MSPVTELQQLLAQRKGHSPEARQTIQKWQDRVQNLCLEVEGWLASLRESGDLLVDRTQNETTEYEFGTYTTPGLNLRFTAIPGNVTLIAKSPSVAGIRLPSGASRRGFQGRVDLSYSVARIPIALDKDHRWVIGVDTEIVPLTDTSFVDALKKLLNL